MSDETARPGVVGWTDLTVDDAGAVRDFYAAVAGWTAQPVSMGEYEDYCMAPPGGNPVAGICHRRGPNADLPPQWMIYIVVADFDASVQRVRGLGGEIISGPKGAKGEGRTCFFRDPAGAVAAIYEPPGQ
jgi:uncharacterized protein